MLSRYNDLYKLFSSHDCPLNPNIRNLNAILKMLKQEYSFLREGESTSQQQCDEIEPIICYTSLYYKWSVLVQLIN